MAAVAKESHVDVTHVGAVPLKEGRDALVTKTLAAFGIKPDGNAATWPVSSFSAKNGTPQVARKDPTTGKVLAHVQNCTWEECDEALANCVAAQKKLCKLTGDQRVAFIEKLNVALEAKLADFSTLLTLEVGKVPTESRGEMIEVFDVVDVIRKRSAELGGDKPYFNRVYDSCDPKRRELGWKGNERHLPVGVVGKMTAFNFPYAVYGWGALPALATGNAVILKPHPAATLTSLAMVKVMSEVCKAEGLEGVVSMISMASFEDTAKLWKDPRVSLWEVTGGEAMGQAFMRTVGPSFRRTVLELGGNNAVIVDKDCNLSNVVESCLFGSTGTAGQRCTTTRSIFIHADVYDEFVRGFVEGYKTKLRIGDPLQPGVNVGPVHHERSVKLFQDTVAFYKKQGSKMLVGGSVIDGNFVQPTVFEAPADKGVNYDAIKTEYFTPVVHVVKFSGDVQEVVDAINSTGYGLSCGVFTTNDALWEQCVSQIRVGICNRNYGTSGAEAGENFGGEGKTGNGRMMGPAIFTQYTRYVNSMISPADSKVVHAQGVDVN